MFIGALAKTAADALISVLLAPECAVCNAVLATSLDGCVCRNCWASVQPIILPVCDACGDPLPRAIDSQVCHSCSLRPRVIDRARAIGEYDGTLRDIIHALKYQQRLSVARGLAALMRSPGRELLEAADLAVPVPLHRRRERTRGFNQAHELARHLGLPVGPVLVRARHTASQVELPADRRHANVQGAFTLRGRWIGRSAGVKGQTIVLVDDVSTTGSTLEACASVLKEAGAAQVYALTAARVVTKRH